MLDKWQKTVPAAGQMGGGVGVGSEDTRSFTAPGEFQTKLRKECDAFIVLPFTCDPEWLGKHKFWIWAAEKKNEDPSTKPY